mgnify:CR=1 FL=1
MIINTTSVVVSNVLSYYLTLLSRDNASFSDNCSFLLFIVFYAIIGLAAMITGIVFLIKYLRRFIYDKGTTPIPRGKAFYVVWLNIGTILFFLICAFMFASSVFWRLRLLRRNASASSCIWVEKISLRRNRCSVSLDICHYFFPFLLCLTASDKRYSICPFMDRKSSSAQAERSCQRAGDNRRRSCFFADSLFSANDCPSFMTR